MEPKILMKTGYLIDSEHQEIRVVSATTNEELAAFTGGGLEIACLWRSGEVCYVDRNGLLKPQDAFFRIPERRGDTMPLPGNGLVVGREIEDFETGEYWHADPSFSIEALAAQVVFVTFDQAKAWGKANASEAAITLDSSKGHEVLTRFGEMFAAIQRKTRENS
jgi:hypothetical protein